MAIRLAVVTVLVLIFSACSATELKPGADRILVSPNAAPKGCHFLGAIVGEQGGSLTGGLTSNANLTQGAMNDMRNKALDLGANYVQMVTNHAGNTGSGSMYSSSTQQTDVTNTGNAYKCKPDDIGL